MADLSTCLPLTRASVIEAHKIIEPLVHLTPVLTNKTLTQLASTPQDANSLVGTKWEGRTPAQPVLRLWFKCENFQRIGAFKSRGAFYAIERLKLEPGWIENGGKEKGVVTHSSGNHAQALSLAARESGIPAHIIMPSVSRPNKVAATKGYGAKVYHSGSTSTEREAVAAQVVSDTGARLVPPYDHPDIMLGQGTMGLEFQHQVREQLPKGLDCIMTPCGGGGMLSGVALSCEGTGIRVFGSEPEFDGADDGRRGFEAGKRIESVNSLTIADGLRTPVGVHPWSVIYERKLVSGMFAVSEEQILQATKLVFERFKLVIEPSAAVPLATALFNEDFRGLAEKEAGETGWDLGLVFSGGNIAMDGLTQLFAV
ncbi:serine racemase [Dactylonectria macrodidyma]|uniref:Serine racemase n=1 Tax=Dactylonectria macrodidyma TaxID=307937 RepID=A0A9P9J884_9HYPO|nr:serine racemase [Dactylonectria macrodidyma]